MDGVRLRIATKSGALALVFSSALIATGAPTGILAVGTGVGIVVIWRYTGAFALLRADWAEARQIERQRRDERNTEDK